LKILIIYRILIKLIYRILIKYMIPTQNSLLELWQYFNDNNFEAKFDSIPRVKRLEISNLMDKHGAMNNIKIKKFNSSDTFIMSINHCAVTEIVSIITNRNRSYYFLVLAGEKEYNYYSYLRYLIDEN